MPSADDRGRTGRAQNELSHGETVSGFKAVLQQGGAVPWAIGQVDGFLATNGSKSRYRVVAQSGQTLRKFGMSKYADELVVTMNRAAEAAEPEAKQLLIDAVRSMSVEDAREILRGGDASATDYFRPQDRGAPCRKIPPHRGPGHAQGGVGTQLQRLCRQAGLLWLIGKEQANINDYVTQKALDGLFLMIAEEERAIRANPVEQGSRIISKVFGALL